MAETDLGAETFIECPACEGDRASYMGEVGIWLWYRCRCCGIEFRQRDGSTR